VKENDGLAALSPVSSQFLPYSFWYPTPTSWFYTGGADFAPFKITVNGASGLMVVSSGSSSSGSFEQQMRGQPFFLTGKFVSETVDGVEVVHIPRGTNPAKAGRVQELASLMKKANDYVGSSLGTTLKSPLRLVLAKRGAGFADSGTVLADDSVLFREKIDSQVVQTIAEGIAKSHLGNAVSVEGDGFGVIREGLARFLSNEFIEAEFGEEAAEVERLQQRANYAAVSRRDAPLNVVSPADGYYYTSTANKGAMIWSYLADADAAGFLKAIRDQASDGKLELAELRSAFSNEKAYLDYTLDRVTEMNLMIGLPQRSGGQVRSALRNLGEIDARVTVSATTASGKKLRNEVTVKARDFGEAVFATTEEIVRVEIDEKKGYPQTEYADDIAPRVIDEDDPLLFIKKEFDRQRFAEAEQNAAAVLRQFPAYDDARVLLARAQFAEGKSSEAEKNFLQVLASKLPSPQSIAWSEFGLGQIAQREGRNSDATERFRKAVLADAEYGATLGAVRALIELGGGTAPDGDVTGFFAGFDRAAISNSKAEVQKVIAGGEVARFSSSVAGQAQQWATRIDFVIDIDSVELLVATRVELKLLNREVESGIAVFRLARTPGGLKLTGVEIFEVS
jgi:tetratricopeptide (TPR) repeat protein